LHIAFGEITIFVLNWNNELGQKKMVKEQIEAAVHISSFCLQSFLFGVESFV
jgi:hypothetical protein